MEKPLDTWEKPLDTWEKHGRKHHWEKMGNMDTCEKKLGNIEEQSCDRSEMDWIYPRTIRILATAMGTSLHMGTHIMGKSPLFTGNKYWLVVRPPL